MKKTKTKVEKIINEVPVEAPFAEIIPKEFSVYIKVNGKVTEAETNDIASVILSTKPEFPKTPLTIRVTKNGKTLDRYLQLKDAKRLYFNSITMQMFIKNLIF